MIRSAVIATGGAFLSLLALTEQASACSCAKQTREQAAAQASIVITGRVLNVRRDGANIYARIETVQMLKGSAPPVVEVMTPVSAAACGYNFERGKTLAIAAQLAEQQFRTNTCLMNAINSPAHK
ncbi:MULTISPECIES: hypothetical protein [unclassified Beijerinckia]|uniref:hypothetical protein n=1 Tax=unclassified Beijerinckia TaxID=2638183 RepID=UPI00089820E7|nr:MULTISPECIES: hypothetical protein [unclassified Beijerinckia]MDH7794494.1 hypothetical protein [Beijerinckia sp. GAS462]SEB64282.1 Tissue inhibitor of metalloproteinase [Beijerinckia sp. 28-YEA-48]